MDAQELQRLKELAEFWAGKYHSSIPAVRQGWREAWDELEAFVCNFAERAVSPAESIQSVEDFLPRDLAPTDAEQRLLEHAADERQKGYAEGRRSAMEELHPQWLKEKERADRAEAKLNWGDTDFGEVPFPGHWVSGWPNVQAYGYITGYRAAVKDIAARQAPEPTGWREAVQEFVDRVDRGEIRSTHSYAKFKALLEHPLQQPVSIPRMRLENWIDVIHDNERSMGDRLQSLSSTFSGLLNGDAVDKYPLREIREQKQDTEQQREMRRQESEEAVRLQTLLVGRFNNYRQPYPEGLMGWAHAALEYQEKANTDLTQALQSLLAISGYTNMSDDELNEEARLGNGAAPILLQARIALAQANAQPLQQEGGKDDYPEPLQNFQEGQWWVQKLDEAAKTAADLDFKRAVAVVHHLLKSASDNLQQASTTDIRSAALEDAAAHCDKFGHSRVDAASLAADIRMLKPSENDADPAEDAWLADRLGKLLAGVAVALKGPEPARKRWSYHDLPEIAAKVMLELELHRAKEAAQATPPAHETIVAEAGELVCTACGTTAQATPEGAELPPLPKGKTFITTVPCEISNMFTPEDMHAYARAAIVGSQQAGPDWRAIAEGHALNAATLQEELDALKAADPVAWLTECIKGDRRGQFELAEPNEKASNPDYWSDAFPVYRAAPPQQVDNLLASLREALAAADAEKYDECKWGAFIGKFDRQNLE